MPRFLRNNVLNPGTFGNSEIEDEMLKKTKTGLIAVSPIVLELMIKTQHEDSIAWVYSKHFPCLWVL